MVPTKMRRLTAEELRDSFLAISGELNRQFGGIPARPDLNPEVAFQPRQLMGVLRRCTKPIRFPSSVIDVRSMQNATGVCATRS